MRGGRWSNRPVDSTRLERWLGVSEVERISKAMRGWYGPPIPVGNVPGAVFAQGDGDFSGVIHGSRADNLLAHALGRAAMVLRRLQSASRHWSLKQRLQLNAGFTSLSDLIAESTAGKQRTFRFAKSSGTEVVSSAYTLWRVGAVPAAGAAGAAAPGGTAHVDTDTGANVFANPTGGDTQHLVRVDYNYTTNMKTLLLYDRLFSVLKTASSLAAESVTGVPTRYQGTAGAVDGADGNFAFPEVGSGALGAVAHNHDIIKYRDQDGNDSQTAASIAGRSGAIADSVDLVLGRWYLPLLAGDTGVKDLDSIKYDVNTVTGVMSWVIGHPLAWLPAPLSGVGFILDGINSAFNLARIFDDACLALLSVFPAATTSTNYDVQVTTVAG